MGDNNSYVVPFVWDEKEENLFPTPNLPKWSSLSPESYDSQEGRSSSFQSSLGLSLKKKTPSPSQSTKGKKVAGADDFFPKHADYQLFPPRKEAHHDFFPDYQLFPPPPQPQPQQDQDFIPQQIKNYQLFPPQQEANHDFYQSTYQLFPLFPPQSQQDGHHDYYQKLFPPQSHQEGHQYDFSSHHNYQLPPQQEPHHAQQVTAPPQQDPLHDFISHHVNYMQLPPPPPPPQPHRYLGDDDCSLFMQQQRRNTINNSFFTDNINPGSGSFF